MSDTPYTAHLDTFARDHLPPRAAWPDLVFDLPALHYPPRLNAAAALLDRQAEGPNADRPCIIAAGTGTWTYRQLLDKANRIASVLTGELGVVPGNRVLLRSANNAMMIACWFGVLKAGAIAVATMPLLRTRDLAPIVTKAEIGLALCDERLLAELAAVPAQAPALRRIVAFNSDAADGLEARMALASGTFANVDTAADDVALIAFTSGTTGRPKGTVHFHRDIMAICDTFCAEVLQPRADDVFCGSPPVAFTFGLGGLVTFPFHVGAATVMIEKPSPEALLQAVQEHGATICFTTPIAYRTMAELAPGYRLHTLRQCVSAGETLPLPTWQAFHRATGIRIIDGIGATEMLHIFIGSAGDAIRPGATGKPVPGYQARVVDAEGRPLPPGQTGRLAVKGPTGCRYLADDRQAAYVQDGWNLTGDAYRMDEDGYFWYQARTDDMIISAGYNIAGPEVEEALLAHPQVQECAVIGAPDPGRGTIVKAFVVLRPGAAGDQTMVKQLQDFVKREIAPYKYPRAIEFVSALPRTETGKVQRFRLREAEAARAQGGGQP